MKTSSTRGDAGKKPVTPWLLLVAAAGLLIMGPQANAAAPAANTVIGNQATASYLDASSITQTATSNLVQTVVQQVGAVTLTANAAVSGAPGSTLYVPHILTNSGNGSDTFTISATSVDVAPAVYLDADGNGQPDSTTPVTAAQTLAGGGVLKFVVAYPIPSTATSSFTTTGTVQVVASTTALYTTPSVTNTDTITISTDAAFSVVKSMSVPTATAASGHTWNTPLASGKVGSKTLYTLTFTNSGAAGASLYIKDQLPAGFTYESGSAVWSSLPGVALSESGTVQTGNGATIQYLVTGQIIEAWISNVNPNVTGTISFNVTVGSAAVVGTSATTNVAQYNNLACPGTPTSLSSAQASCTTLVTTNSSEFTVLPTYSLKFGDVDPSAGTPATTDTVIEPSAFPGRPIYFTQTITNTGNATDTFNLNSNYASFTSSFPAGTTFTWLTGDKAAVLLDTNGDGVVDTGPVATNSSISVVLQVVLPLGTAANASANYQVEPQATSVNDNTQTDLYLAQLTAVLATEVDLTNSPASSVAGDVGVGPGTASASLKTGVLGSVVEFPLAIANNDSTSLTFDLQASQSTTFPGTLPSGWTVSFSSTTCSAPTTITQVTVASAGSSTVYACLNSSATGASLSNQPIYFKATSTTAASTGLIVSDTLFDSVSLTAVASYSFGVAPSNSGQVTPAGSITFAHTVTNLGNQSCFAGGNFRVDVTGLPTTWAASAVYIDNNQNGEIDSTDTLVTSTGPSGSFALPSSLAGSLASGASFKLLVRLFAPGGAAVGDQAVVTVNVTDITSTSPCALSGISPTDTATVVSGQVRVVKTQVLDSACAGTSSGFTAQALSVKPGECVVYQVVATNEGTTIITNINVADVVPANTTYAATQPATQCASTGLATGSVALTNSATTVKCGGTNTLSPGGNVTLTFGVQVNQ